MIDEIYPSSLGIRAGDGLHGTPLEGAPLLHLAVECQKPEIATWLLDQGANVNTRSKEEDDNGHTPLYHAVVTCGGRDGNMSQLLLDHGANPNVQANLHKQFRHMGDPEREKMHTYHNITPLGYARQFQEPGMVSASAVALIAERGGIE